ncbi:MAG: SH3 domain-containing protein [Chloroflexi bacterium]|nr:SH3 domain-containing protein [Chloroflexota bacterium]
MSEEFNWLEYVEHEESAPEPERRGRLSRLLSRRPCLPGRPRLRLPRLRRRFRLAGLAFWRRRPKDSAPEQESATSLLDQRAERPLEDLDERLQFLRERSISPSQPSADAQQALYEVDDVLVTPEIAQKPGGVISAGALSKAQRQQVELLQDIVGGATQAEEPAGRRFLPSQALFSLSAAPRMIAAAALLALVSLPFASSDFAVGALPPSEFPEERPGFAAVYEALDGLTGSDFALVALEYGPAAAGELDSLADLVLRHVFARGVKPLIVSSNPIAIAHARNIIRAINRSVAGSGISLLPGYDYHILRFLPGGALGIRELNENFADVVKVSAKGISTGLQLDSLDRVKSIVLISDSAETVRNWAEQVVAASDNAPLLAFTSYSAAPIAQVYADASAEILGLVFGYRDAYTYGEELQASFGGVPPAPANNQSSADGTRDSQANQPQEADAMGERPQATAEPAPTETPLPSATPPPTATPAPTSTALPTATDLPTATATLETIVIVEVRSPQQVRIRRGPTTADDILRLAQTGDTFEVIGANGDGSWYQIALANGLEGWIAAFLVDEGRTTRAAFEAGRASASARSPTERVVLERGFLLSLGKNGPRFYQADAPILSDIHEFVLMRDRSQEAPRLEAMTLGTLAAVLLIVVGNVLSAFGALRGRADPNDRRGSFDD